MGSRRGVGEPKPLRGTKTSGAKGVRSNWRKFWFLARLCGLPILSGFVFLFPFLSFLSSIFGQRTKSGMPGCFLDKVGHRCFHVWEGGKNRWMRLDIARRREGQQDWESYYRIPKH